MDSGVDTNGSALRIVGGGVLLTPLIFLILFFLYPLGTILQVSLIPNGQIDFSGFVTIATEPYYQRLIGFTVGQALLSTALTLLLALPAAYVFARYRFPGHDLLLSLSTLPFVLPTVVVAAALIALLGRDGVFNTVLMSILQLEVPPIRLERTLSFILIAHIFYNYSLALRMIAGYWSNQSQRIEEAARVLGANGWRLWWHIQLPVIRPAVIAAAALVFIFTFTSFGIILLLGGVQFATIEVEIYQQVTGLLNLPLAAALSLVQIGAMLTMMLIYTQLQRRTASAGLTANSRLRRVPRTTPELLAVWLNIIGMVMLTFAPLVALVGSSFTVDGHLSTRYYTLLNETSRRSVLFAPPLEAVTVSLRYALVTTLWGVILGVLAAYLLTRPLRRWLILLDPLFMLPLATSAVTLGFGFVLALDEPPLNLRTSPLLIPIAHTLVALPFVVRSVLPALRIIPVDIRESASVLGASPIHIVRLIDLPLISRSIVVGAVFAFTVSMGEFGATLLIARPDTPTMPVVIFRLLGQPGLASYGQAMAMSVILVFVCAFAFLAIERLRDAGVGEF